jgi:hypothetical protein
MALLDRESFLYFDKQQILRRLNKEIRKDIRWTRVIKAPVAILLVMAFAGASIAGHTYYLESDTQRIISTADQQITDLLQASSAARANDPGMQLAVPQ